MEEILAKSQGHYDQQYALKTGGIDLNKMAARVAELLGIEADQV